MPFDALGNFIPDDDEMSLDAMKYELANKGLPAGYEYAKKGRMPLRPDGSDVPYLASEVPNLVVPVTPKEPPKPYSTATNFPQAVADRLGISAIPQALMAMGTGFASEVAKGTGNKELSKAIQYEPTSRVASDVLAGLEQAPKTITGSHMGFGPMPETWVTGMGSISPNDVRVLAKRGIETGRELRAIPEDFRNAQSGLRRESNLGGETYGARLQSVADDIGDVMARQEARRNRYETYPKSSVEVFGDMIPDSKLYAVRNTGEGQMLRPTTSEGGVEPRGVDYGEAEQFLKEASPPLSVNRPNDIIDMYERTYMSENTPAVRKLNDDWERFQTDRIKEMYPSHFTKAESFKALRSGYPANVIEDMKLKWFHDYVAQKKAEGFEIPSMEEYFARAQAAHTLTKKIVPNIIQKYLGTPTDPFLESAKQGFTMTPADELVNQYLDAPSSLEKARREAGFEPKGEVADKLMPVAESKLATQNAELDKLVADQAEIGRTEGMMVPYPDGRIDPATGAVELATNPNYAQYTNKIKAMRKVIEETEQEVRNLQLAQSYENVSDASIKTGTAVDYRNRIPAEYQQFYPALYSEKPKTTAISPTTYKTPDTAPFFETNLHGLSKTGILPLTVQLVNKIMSGEIPPDQVPSLSQPHTITKFMKDIVAPRVEKEKAARLAMKDYKVNVEKHFVDVVNAIPDSMRIGTNAKLLWIDDATPEAEINQHLSDATFILDHCIGNSGHGGGLKNLFTGDERSYIPFMDPATGQKFKNAGGTSSYMDAVLNGDKDIMMILDDKTGMHVGTIELDKRVGADGTNEYDIGYVSGYKNHSNKHDGIDPKYRDALRDALNMVKDEIGNSSSNEIRSGVYDMQYPNQVEKMKGKLEIPGTSPQEKKQAWEAIKKNIMDTLDGDRFITIDQAKDAVKEYKQANPPVPAVSSGFPSAGKDITERNIIMQGLSRENMDTTRQLYAARMVGNGNDRFQELALASSNMDPRPFQAYREILASEQRRADPVRGISDYELFRNLQNYVDQIDNGDLRFSDFNLNGASELLDLREGIQKHADVVGQLAHYADVLQRNGFQSPLPSEQTGAPEWQTYQRYLDELGILGIDNPQDFRTRLLDTINHGDLREIDPQLDEIQRINLRHLLEIHERSIKQAMDYPAPTAPAEQRGISLAQWSDMTQNAMAEIGANYGDATRQAVGQIMADAIAYQMDVPANERPVQMSNFLTSQAREAANPLAVRQALRDMAGAIDQTNADIQNARNAPAPTTALPSLREYGEALITAEQDIPANIWADVSVILSNIQNEIIRDGGMYHQHPATIVQRLNEEADYQEGEGEPDTATGLRNLAGEIARLVPANPPASMALANQNAVRNQPTRQLVAGQEALSNSIIDALNDNPVLAPSISDRLNALQWRENLVNDPAGLVRNIRIEADAEANAGNESLASSFYDIANLIADERGETLFTPAGRQAQAPTQSSRDLAISAEEQRNTNRVEQVVALTDGIDRQLDEIRNADRASLMGLVDYYADANQLPDSITDHTNRYDDAVRIASFLRQHAQARLDAMPPERNQLTTANMPTPRDIAERVAPDSTHQSLEQRQRQVQQIAEGINNEIRSLPTREPGLSQALEFYRDYDNLPTEMMSRIPSQEDAELVLSHIRRHIETRLANLNQPQNRGQGRQVERDAFFNRLNHVIDDTILTASNNPRYADMQDMPTVLEREINSYHQNSENLPQFIQYLRDDASNVETNVLGDEWHQNYVREIRHLIDRLERMQRDMPQMAMSQTFHQEVEPAQLPAPATNNVIEQQNQRIGDAIVQRAELVNQNHLGVSQRFDSIVRVAANEADPQTDTVNFISSLHHRANSVDRVGDREATILANQLRHLAADVNDVLHTQPALPAPDPVAQHFERVEQGVNQPAGMGALNNQQRGMANLYSVNFLNGDRNALTGLAPEERQLVEVLTRYREPEDTVINELNHRRLINTLTSETYNPATDGETLIRLAETRSGMFIGINEAQQQQIIDIINKWNFLRFPNYSPPEEGMGLEPEGRKRGGFIRKMNEGGEPPKLTPYEQFKIDNAERIRQGNELNENRNKYDPYKGSDRPIPTQRSAPRGASGSAGVIPSGSGPSYMDRPRLYSIGGKVYMDVGGQVKPVPNIPTTPEKTRPNPTDHVIKRPVDEGFREIYEKYRNPPKPSGSAGTMPSGSGASYLDRPHLYAGGGRAHMNDGGMPEYQGMTGMGGIDPRQDTRTPAEYNATGLPPVTGDPYDVWEAKYQLNQATRDKLNFNDPAYTLGMKEIQAVPFNKEFGGQFDPKSPSTVKVANSPSSPKTYSQTLSHEGQHLQDYHTDEYGVNQDWKNRSFLERVQSNALRIPAYLNQRAIENNFRDYRDRFVKENPDADFRLELGGYHNQNPEFSERIADLVSIEGNLKRGQRFTDTEMGKAILNTPELQNYYYQSARPMEAKALPYEPSVFDRIKNASRNFKEKSASGKSYADSAYESLKEFKDGGDVNIDAMRLALMKG
jgi:hypothetical protein